MVARGRVENGVVVLQDGVRLPEGQEVIVVSGSEANSHSHSILDIPTVSVGAVLPFREEEADVLGEMLEDRG